MGKKTTMQPPETRHASGGVAMSTLQIVILVGALAIGVIWAAIWAYRGWSNGRRAASEAADRAGVLYTVRCEKCGNQRQAPYSEVTAHAMSKEKSVSTKAGMGLFEVGGTYYEQFSKKMMCPRCGKETWHQLVDYHGNDAQSLANTGAAIGPILVGTAIGLAGLTAVCLLALYLITTML